MLEDLIRRYIELQKNLKIKKRRNNRPRKELNYNFKDLNKE